MVLGVVLEQVEAVAKPLLVPVLKNPSPVPSTQPMEQGRSENPTPPVSGGYLELRPGTMYIYIYICVCTHTVLTAYQDENQDD